MTQVAIIGAAGLSGRELIRICSRHPAVELVAVTSARYAGQVVGEAFPELSRGDRIFAPPDAALNGPPAAFLPAPNPPRRARRRGPLRGWRGLPASRRPG